jgi:UDPglucose--hexose-1-phosphate uridylyltransferase
MSINYLIDQLVGLGIKAGIVPGEDEIYVRNLLLEMLKMEEYYKDATEQGNLPLEEILKKITDYAWDEKLIKDNTITHRDLFDTKLMGCLTPRPSQVISCFFEFYKKSPEAATEYFYSLSKYVNYIRTERIKKDEKWITESSYGDIEITINLSKPEKDPRDIAAAKNHISSGYPKCLLCYENEGYSGRIDHPARQNLRVIPIKLDGKTGDFNILHMYIIMSTVSWLIKIMFL